MNDVCYGGIRRICWYLDVVEEFRLRAASFERLPKRVYASSSSIACSSLHIRIEDTSVRHSGLRRLFNDPERDSLPYSINYSEIQKKVLVYIACHEALLFNSSSPLLQDQIVSSHPLVHIPHVLNHCLNMGRSIVGTGDEDVVSGSRSCRHVKWSDRDKSAGRQSIIRNGNTRCNMIKRLTALELDQASQEPVLVPIRACPFPRWC